MLGEGGKGVEVERRSADRKRLSVEVGFSETSKKSWQEEYEQLEEAKKSLSAQKRRSYDEVEDGKVFPEIIIEGVSTDGLRSKEQSNENVCSCHHILGRHLRHSSNALDMSMGSLLPTQVE